MTCAHVIRDRFKLLGEVRIRTAQGRLTAGILIALPPAMILLLRGMNPDYVNLLFTDPGVPTCSEGPRSCRSSVLLCCGRS